MSHPRLNTLGASPDNILGQGKTSFNTRTNTFQPSTREHTATSTGFTQEDMNSAIEAALNEFLNQGGGRAPQAFGDTEAGFRAQLDLRNRTLQADIASNNAQIAQAKAELASADRRHAAELRVRITELEETLKFQREELAENQRQFDASFGEGQRQFDERLGFDQSALISDRFGQDPLRQAFAALGLDTSNLVTAEGNALSFGGGDPASQTGGTAEQAAANAGLGVSTALGLDPGSINVSREEGVTGLPSVVKAATATQQGGGAVANLLQSAFGLGDKVSGGVSGEEFTRRIQDVTPRGSLTF